MLQPLPILGASTELTPVYSRLACTGRPKLEAVFQIQSDKCRERGMITSPPPALAILTHTGMPLAFLSQLTFIKLHVYNVFI